MEKHDAYVSDTEAFITSTQVHTYEYNIFNIVNKLTFEKKF